MIFEGNLPQNKTQNGEREMNNLPCLQTSSTRPYLETAESGPLTLKLFENDIILYCPYIRM